MDRRVIVGDAFESLEAQVIEAETKANESKTRSNLAYGAAAGGILSLLISTGIGIYDGSFNEVQSVWNVFGPIAGAILGHYFGGKGNTNGNGGEN